MEGGFIKLWRSLLAKPIMQHDGLCRLWVYCLLKAEWSGKKRLLPGTVEQVETPRGSFITTRMRLYAELYPKDDHREMPAPAPRTLWRWLESLRAMECLKLENMSNHGTLVTIVNYESYQGRSEECDQPMTNRCPTGDQPVTNIPLEEEGKKERIEEPAAAKNATNGDPHSPELLAREWVFHRRGTKGRDELDRARETFQELIRLGHSGAEIAAEITRKERRKTEPVWDFEKRILGDAGQQKGKPGLMDSLIKFAEKEGEV